MLRAAFLFVTCALVAITNTAEAQDSDAPSEDIIMGAWSNQAECNRTNASRVSFTQFLASYKARKGTCVAVEGFWYGRALFKASRDGRTTKSNTSGHLRKKRIGLYARSELLEAAPARPERYLFVGRVGECETQWPGAMMVMGYCHYTGGPILLVSEAVKSSTPTRG